MSPYDASPGRHAAETTPAFVRSFTVTRGRAVPRVDIPFEATLVATGSATAARPTGRHADVLALCDGRSLAEISAQLELAIGVVRVLVGDLVVDGHVTVRRTLTDRSSVDERRELLERTLAGLLVG